MAALCLPRCCIRSVLAPQQEFGQQFPLHFRRGRFCPAGEKVGTVPTDTTVIVVRIADAIADATPIASTRLINPPPSSSLLVKPLAAHWFMKPEEVAALQAKGAEAAGASGGSYGIGKGGFDAAAGAFWLFVGVPLLWGVWLTLQSAVKIFQ